jgi:hypothetical protein
MTLRSYFSDPYPKTNEFFGIITGTFNLSQLPNIPGKLFRLQARSGNTGSIFLGNTRSTGSFPLLPWQFAANYDSDWFSADNLNRYYIAGSSGSCYLSFWVQC